MRQLTKKQIEVLDLVDPECATFDELAPCVQKHLQSINDTEVLHQQVTNYLMEKIIKRNYGIA